MESTDGGRRWGHARLPGTSAASGGEAWPPVFSSGSNGALAAWYGTEHGAVTAIYFDDERRQDLGRTPVARSQSRAVSSRLAVHLVRSYRQNPLPHHRRQYQLVHVRGSLNVGGVQASNTLDFVNTVDGWAVVEGRVWHTTDEGRMWVHEVLPT